MADPPLMRVELIGSWLALMEGETWVDLRAGHVKRTDKRNAFGLEKFAPWVCISGDNHAYGFQ